MKQNKYKLIDIKSQIPLFNLLIKVNLKLNADIYIVGGLIRDLILGRDNNDLDLVPFDADYRDIAKEIRKYLKCTMIAFKDNVRLVKDDFVIDVSAPRGNHIIEDLQYRDFTINNLAIDMNGNLIGNVDDFEKRLIRAVYDKTFDDDPLRIIRAFRFVSQLNFGIEDETMKLINEKKEKLGLVASERIFDEMKKMMNGDFFQKSLDLFYKSEVLEVLIPELKNLKNTGYNKYHKEDALTHTVNAVKIAHNFTKKLKFNSNDTVIFITAMMLHDLGKGDETYKYGKSFVGHEKISCKIAEKVMNRLNYPKKMIKNILDLIINHSKLRIYATEGVKNYTLQKFVYKYIDNIDGHIRVAIVDALAKSNNNYMENLFAVIKKIRKLMREMNFELKSLISGNDLIKLGIKPNPRMKEILDDVHFKLVTGELKNKQDAEKYIKNNYL